MPIVDGLDKMAMDVTGKTEVTQLNDAEVAAMREYCEGVHERRLTDGLGPKPVDPGEALTPPDELAWFEKQLTQDRVAREREKAYEEARAARKPSLDEMGWGEQQRKEEQEENLKEKAKEEKKKEAKKKQEDEALAKQREYDKAYNSLLQGNYGRKPWDR